MNTLKAYITEEKLDNSGTYFLKVHNYSEDAFYFDWHFLGETNGVGSERTPNISYKFPDQMIGKEIKIKLVLLDKNKNQLDIIEKKLQI